MKTFISRKNKVFKTYTDVQSLKDLADGGHVVVFANSMFYEGKDSGTWHKTNTRLNKKQSSITNFHEFKELVDV